MKKYISTTLPYINGNCHIGYAFEVVLADIIAEFYRYKLGNDNVFFNVGIDEHGQKIYEKSQELNYSNTQEYCDHMYIIWKNTLENLSINYNNFYRTTDIKHAINVRHYYDELKEKDNIYKDVYVGKYCTGCEAFITNKDVIKNKCIIHKVDVEEIFENNNFFKLKKYAHLIKNILIDKSLSLELENQLKQEYNLSITRPIKKAKWGIIYNENKKDEIFYVWAEAIISYYNSIKDNKYFKEFWNNSLIICGKDNLKFQAFVLQALLLANDIPQTKEILVHGTILDEQGNKMSKSIGNVIDPIEQINKFGSSALRLYLFFGLNTFGDSKYSEKELINLWNSFVVNGLGNLISRTLHLVDIRSVVINEELLSETIKTNIQNNINNINIAFEKYKFDEIFSLLNKTISELNLRFEKEKPFSDTEENKFIVHEIYHILKSIVPYFKFVLKEFSEQLDQAFVDNKKIIIFDRK